MKFRNLLFFRPFFVYPPLAALMMFFALRTKYFSGLETGLLLLLGLFEWMLLEYILHRYFFHIDTSSKIFYKLFQERHHNHHLNPKVLNYTFVPVTLGLGLSAVSLLLRVAVVWSWQGAFIVTVGIWAGYLFYEYVHYAAHMLRSRNPLFRYLKIYHLKHHHQDEKLWYGVTTPFIDYLFRTYRNIKSPNLGAHS